MSLASLCVALLPGCQTSKPPEALTIQTSVVEAAAVPKGSDAFLPACRDGAVPRDVRDNASAAQRAISSWYAVIGNLERCDYSRVRYYSSDDNEQRLLHRIRFLQWAGPVSCQAEALEVEQRTRETFEAVREWVALSGNLCTLNFRADIERRRAEDMEAKMTSLRCKIRTAFPELSAETTSACDGHLGSRD